MAEPIPINNIISRHRMFNRNYTPKQLLGEIINLINSGEYEDFIFVAAGDVRSVRIGSGDRDLRTGDLLHLLEMAKEDVLRI